MPKEQIRHNSISERIVEDSEELSPKKLFQRAAGEGRTVEFQEKKQLSSPSGFTLFCIALFIVGIMVAISLIIMWAFQVAGV